MVVMIVIGGVLCALGLAGLIWCIRKAATLRGAQMQEDQIRTELNRLIFMHMASIGGAFLGLGLLVTGLILS